MKCRICGTDGLFEKTTLREMMFGTREHFAYVSCPACHCLQIQAIPDDLSRHYAGDYYSHQTRIEPELKHGLKGVAIRAYCRSATIHPTSLITKIIKRTLPKPIDWDTVGDYLYGSNLRDAAERILDVGCGSSPYRLAAIKRCGFGSVEGLDPFIAEDLSYFGVPVRKCTLSEIKGTFGLVMFHHSLEHVIDPVKELVQAAKLLRSNGTCLVRIPVMGTWFWREFGADWVELDAPRHLHLMSVQSMEHLATRTGFRIRKVVFDSQGWEIAASTLQQRNIPWGAVKELRDHFDRDELAGFQEKATQLNAQSDGGRACFYLERI